MSMFKWKKNQSHWMLRYIFLRKLIKVVFLIINYHIIPCVTLTILTIFMNFEIIKRLLTLKNKTIQWYELYENLLAVFSNCDH